MFKFIIFVFTLGLSQANCQAVNVELYFESLCPDSINFITTQLYPTWEALHQTGIMSVTLYPYGNAHQSMLTNGTWEFTCQHGPMECYLNTVEICIQQAVEFDESIYLPVINCIENSTDPFGSAEDCVQKTLPYVSWDTITECVEGPDGNAWMHVIGSITDQLDPPHKFVPWVVINEKHDDTIQAKAEENLLELVCDTYIGEKPAECLNTEKNFHQMLKFTFNSIQIEVLN